MRAQNFASRIDNGWIVDGDLMRV